MFLSSTTDSFAGKWAERIRPTSKHRSVVEPFNARLYIYYQEADGEEIVIAKKNPKRPKKPDKVTES